MDFSSAFDTTVSPAASAITGALLLAVLFFYRWLLPKPIAGIPYNPEAIKSIFGDIPSLIRYSKTSKTVTDWFMVHHDRHNSPIVQIWPNIFQRQWVIVNDFREAQDVLMRRTKEFDKPDFLGDIMFGQTPEHHILLKSNDEWRGRRKIIADLISPAFLTDIAAPQLHASFMDLMELWQNKIRLGQGRPFTVKTDIFDAALEAIWATLFGIEDTDTITRKQVRLLSSLGTVPLPSTTEEEVHLDRAPAPPAFEAVLRLTDTFEYTIKSPCPRIMGFLVRYLPSIRRYTKVKDQAISEQISQTERRIVQDKQNAGHIRSGLEHILRREVMAAEKQGRVPGFYTSKMRDEIFGLLIAGHDTTSTTLSWAVKFLTASQSTQSKLRSHLHTTFADAKAEDRVPSASEIVKTPNHYLDACIEESLRCSQTTPTPSRTATKDAVILGHLIPKGTRVLFCSNGSGILKPSFPITDNLRSETYHKAGGGKVGSWDADGIADFRPERWMVRDNDTGSEVFNPQAGPQMQFSLGQRSCFGKKIAYLEMRIALALILWKFELMEVPEKYASWEAMEQLTRTPVQVFLRLSNT